MTRLPIVLAALALWLCAAPAAEAARTEFFGIVRGPALDAQDLQGIRAARVRTARFLLFWPEVQPSEASFDWAANDLVVGDLASRGIRPLPFLFGSPQWVGSGQVNRAPIDSAADEQAWGDFLKAAVARYGPGGSYWANEYRQQYGTGALPLPVQSWQVWNEPNLKKFWAPAPSSQRYARLVRISHDAIRSRDPKARIVLAGLWNQGDVKAWTFLNNLYAVSGIKSYFDAAALHPYGCNLDQTREGLVKFRASMTSHADGATPLWITEFAWGSGPVSSDPRFCKEKGLTGQQNLLSSSFKLILNNRKNWNVQRLFWFFWRDPAAGSPYADPSVCHLCGSAGLLRYDRSPKPAYSTFRSFTAETTPPVASITSGPSQGSFTKDSTPTFSFTSSEAGSTFACRFDAGAFKPCSSPFTRGSPLSDGAHTFYVKAIDAPGNESAVVSRSFTVDTVAPATTITAGPSGSTTDSTPTFTFTSSESGSTFACRFDSQPFAACSGPGASHTPSTALSVGGHSFAVRATDRAKNTDPTPAKRTFTVITP